MLVLGAICFSGGALWKVKRGSENKILVRGSTERKSMISDLSSTEEKKGELRKTDIVASLMLVEVEKRKSK